MTKNETNPGFARNVLAQSMTAKGSLISKTFTEAGQLFAVSWVTQHDRVTVLRYEDGRLLPDQSFRNRHDEGAFQRNLKTFHQRLD